jgi:hypothetical protein
VLAGGEEQDTAAGAQVVVPGRELSHEEQRRADVLVEERVELVGRQLSQSAVAAARMVDDEDVEWPERVGGGADNGRRRSGIREVGLDELDTEFTRDGFRAAGLRPPALPGVVLRPALDEDRSARIEQTFRDCEADAGAAADSGDKRVPSGEGAVRQRRCAPGSAG